MSPEYQVVKDFESAIAKWAGAPYAVAVESGTAAIFLSLMCAKGYLPDGLGEITLPNYTYPSVPCSVIHAGGKVKWSKKSWNGTYRLAPYDIIDSALRFRAGMYVPKSLYCLSFHIKKHLPIGRGGMILTDNERVYEWLKRARFDGRGEKTLLEDDFTMLGYNMYMTPEQASRGLQLFNIMKDKTIPDLSVDAQKYPDLSKFPIYT